MPSHGKTFDPPPSSRRNQEELSLGHPHHPKHATATPLHTAKQTATGKRGSGYSNNSGDTTPQK